MEWLGENRFSVLVFILFIGMHLFGHGMHGGCGGHGGHGGHGGEDTHKGHDEGSQNKREMIELFKDEHKRYRGNSDVHPEAWQGVMEKMSSNRKTLSPSMLKRVKWPSHLRKITEEGIARIARESIKKFVYKLEE